mgnify:CR=1 FL=1
MSRRAVILLYHAVDDLAADPVLSPFGVPAARFGAQLRALRRSGRRFVSLQTLLDGLEGRAPLPRRSVLVTFDDAYVSVLESGVPELRRAGAPAVVFAVAGQLGGTNAWDNQRGTLTLPLLDADGLHRLTDAGIEIGSHALSHRRLTEIDAAAVDEELVTSADLLERAGLPRPRSLAYPHGEVDAHVARAAREAGYAAAFTIEAGVADARTPRMLLPRVVIYAGDSPLAVAVKVLLAGHPRLTAALGRLHGLRG